MAVIFSNKPKTATIDSGALDNERWKVTFYRLGSFGSSVLKLFQLIQIHLFLTINIKIFTYNQRFSLLSMHGKMCKKKCSSFLIRTTLLQHDPSLVR